jgi:hypothetical protein
LDKTNIVWFLLVVIVLYGMGFVMGAGEEAVADQPDHHSRQVLKALQGTADAERRQAAIAERQVMAIEKLAESLARSCECHCGE